MHCRFDANVQHSETEFTRFVALDKCLPNRKCLDFITINESEEAAAEEGDKEEQSRAVPVLQYDLEWLTVLHLTNNLLNVNRNYTKLPLAPGPDEPLDSVQRFEFTPTQQEMDAVLAKFKGDLTIPQNFIQSMPAYDPQRDGRNFRNLNPMQVPVELNPQSTEFCEKLGIDDPLFLVAQFSKINLTTSTGNYGSSTADESNAKRIESPPPARAPLASFLPQPKFANDEEIDLDDLEAEGGDNNDNDDNDKEAAANPVEIVDGKEVEQEQEEKTASEPTKAEPEPPTPPMKKFKRRNQEIYANEDE